MLTNEASVLKYLELPVNALAKLVARYAMKIKVVASETNIPGSFWQPPEAGLIGHTLYVRDDTPVHSALHETCHYICMDDNRRRGLDTDAGGDYDEENAVCYLQLLLAGHLSGYSLPRAMQDMDDWGYSFRLGSTRVWFEQDAQEAREWLLNKSLISADNTPTWRIHK